MDDNDSNIIHVPVTLDSVNRKKDRSVSLKFTTLLEIPNEEFAVMDRFHQEAGHLLFRRNAFTEEEIPQEDVEKDTEESQSVQIRNALWVLYRARGGNGADKEKWNMFYRKNMQAIKARILQEVHDLEDKK